MNFYQTFKHVNNTIIAKKIDIENTKKNFVEKYLVERVVISTVDNSREITKKYSKSKKAWVKRFKKALINNRVVFDDNQKYINDKSHPVTASWYKTINFPRPRNWKIKKRDYTFPTDKQKQLISQLKHSPIFVVKNVFDEIVSGENRLNFYMGPIEKLFNWYYKKFLWDPSDELNEPVTVAFAFSNHKDAQELQSYLLERYPYSSKEVGLSVEAIDLSQFYILSRKAPPMNQIRIIPDVMELGNLLNNFRKKRHVHFHPKQIYGKDFFQGSPLYRLKPIKVAHKAKGRIGTIELNYSPIIDQCLINDTVYYFTSFKDAEESWAKVYKHYKHLGIRIPKTPSIEVYNLESLLYDYENDLESTPEKFQIRSSCENYDYIRNALSEPTYNQFKNSFFARVRIWVLRFLWGWTHRTPPQDYPPKW